MKTLKDNIPNVVTSINLLSGCVAVAMAFKSGGDPLSPAFMWAYIAIGVAAVADFCDGFASRLLHAYSDMGKELDSLCDMVSFGVAPAALVYNLIRFMDYPEWLAWIVLMIPLCAALRLARFNIDTTQTTTFRGLPVPANAIFWIGLTCFMADGMKLPEYVLATVIVVESLYMVSSFPMLSLKFKTWGWKGNSLRWMLIAGSIALILILGIKGLMWVIVYYAALSCLPVRDA